MEESSILDKQRRHKWNSVEFKLEEMFTKYFYELNINNYIDEEHLKYTPKRIVDSMYDMVKGVYEKPETALNTLFKNRKYDEIVYVNDISFSSVCAHHFLPFIGKVHFGYLPDVSIVGLSKIPRLVNVFARRPQVQEQLTQDIVDSFMEIVKPKGCGAVIEAWHLCMMIRGTEQRPAYTKTTALRGTFKDLISTKQEFLDGVKQASRQIWP